MDSFFFFFTNTARYLQLMDNHLKAGYRFCLGSRPCGADFAMFGQLHPMISLE